MMQNEHPRIAHVQFGDEEFFYVLFVVIVAFAFFTH